VSEHEGQQGWGDAAGDDELLDEQADTAEDFIHDLLDALDMDGEAAADVDEDLIYVDVRGPDMGVLIGRHGATLEALQELVRAAVQHQTEAHTRLIVDVEGYRERQRERLERDARGVAARVRRESKAEALEPMNAFERRLVHTALKDFDGVRTHSEGQDPDRHIVISPA
jgi:spoIIIJ-associated protein